MGRAAVPGGSRCRSAAVALAAPNIAGRIRHKPAVALSVAEIGQGLGAAFTPPYGGGRGFESTAAHIASPGVRPKGMHARLL